MSTKAIYGRQPAKTSIPGGFAPNRKGSRQPRMSDVTESARRWLFRRGIEQVPFRNDCLFVPKAKG